ncbi:universal stress protein [Streptomyces sp. SID2131]|nr:universal stress protein [Streptomyces sp. SID2131]
MNTVLVGVDPQELSVPALLWAADEAARRGLRLHMVTAVPPVHDRLAYDAFHHGGALRTRAESALANAEDLVRELHPGLSSATELVDGPPAAVLRERAASAVLAVVGSRHLGRAAEIFSEGSVALPLTACADCPVVVVRVPEHTLVHPPTLVVGVDGSASSRAAVAFAAEEANLRGARLRTILVRPRPAPTHETEARDLAACRRLLAASVADLHEHHPGVEVTEEVVSGHPVERLALAARSAVALVVGRRGSGGYTGMRIGSTVHGLLHHAECPVITVPPTGRGDTGDDLAQAERSSLRTGRPAPV